MVSMPRCGCHGNPAQVVVGNVVPEVVQQQERVVVGGVAEPEGAAQLDAGALNRRSGLDDRLTGRTDIMYVTIH